MNKLNSVSFIIYLTQLRAHPKNKKIIAVINFQTINLNPKLQNTRVLFRVEIIFKKKKKSRKNISFQSQPPSLL
jgi:hypothetical protein